MLVLRACFCIKWFRRLNSPVNLVGWLITRSSTAIPNADERHRGRWQREILEAGLSSRSRSVLLAIWPSWRPRRRERPAGPAASLHRPANRRAHVTEGLGSSRRRPGLRGCADDVGRVGGGNWQPDARRGRHFKNRPGWTVNEIPSTPGCLRGVGWIMCGQDFRRIPFVFFFCILSRLTGRCSRTRLRLRWCSLA